VQQNRLAYPVPEAAHRLGLSVRSLRYLLRSGRLSHVRLGRRVLIRHQDIEALLRKHYVKGAAAVEPDAPMRLPTAQAQDCTDA
jgi:excisionase family DNA binding protein